MLPCDVCGVVVTYHPDEEVLENLAKLRPQVSNVVVVDNGSSEGELALLDEAAGRLGMTVERNWDNLGVATALNRGVRWARERGFEWVMLFDQDSTITPGFVDAMLQCAQNRPNANSLAILVPRYVDSRFGTVREAPARDEMGMEAATTSGSLMPTEIFEVAGMFAEELFIDGVDFEYSLRVRQLGLCIDECAEAVLLHSPGTPTYHKLLGWKPFQVANYSPVRRYYQERNKIWMAKRYWHVFRGFCIRQFVSSVKDLVKIVLVEGDKFAKCQYFFEGIRDGLRGRTGKLRSRV